MIQDAALYVVMIFFVAISLIVVFISYDEISNSFNAINATIGSDNAARFEEGKDRFPTTWDYTFLTVFIGVMIGVLIISYFLASNPVFFFVFMFIVIVFGGFAGYLSNAFEQIVSDSVLGASAANFPIMSFIMNNYLLFVVATIMLMLIVFYAKPQDGGFI